MPHLWGHNNLNYSLLSINNSEALKFDEKQYFCPGEMAEWSIAAVLKTVEG